MTTLALIAAIARDGAIGQAGGLPWPTLRGDRRWFRLLTTAIRPELMALSYCDTPIAAFRHRPGRCYQAAWPENAIIMGRTTLYSLVQPLEGRVRCVLSRPIEDDRLEGLRTTLRTPIGLTRRATSLAGALRYAEQQGCPYAWVIGGAQVYAEALQHPGLGCLYLTEIDAEYHDADTYFPAIWLAEDDMPEQRITKRQPDGTLQHWRRTHGSPWIEEPGCPRYRFGIWKRQA